MKLIYLGMSMCASLKACYCCGDNSGNKQMSQKGLEIIIQSGFFIPFEPSAEGADRLAREMAQEEFNRQMNGFLFSNIMYSTDEILRKDLETREKLFYEFMDRVNKRSFEDRLNNYKPLSTDAKGLSNYPNGQNFLFFYTSACDVIYPVRVLQKRDSKVYQLQYVESPNGEISFVDSKNQGDGKEFYKDYLKPILNRYCQLNTGLAFFPTTSTGNVDFDQIDTDSEIGHETTLIDIITGEIIIHENIIKAKTKDGKKIYIWFAGYSKQGDKIVTIFEYAQYDATIESYIKVNSLEEALVE